MRKLLKVFHLLGTSGFLGSIAVYIALSPMIEHAEPQAFATLRQAILTGTRYVTLPSLVVLMICGAYLGWTLRAKPPRWLLAKLLIGVGLCLNCYLFVLPAIESAAMHAAASVNDSALRSLAMMDIAKETGFGAVNLILALAAIFLGVFRPQGKRQH